MKYILPLMGIIISILVQSQDGTLLYQQKCASCHTIGNGRLVGPDLKDIAKKRDHRWLVSFIRSSQSMIRSGDKQALSVYEAYNGLLMPDAGLNDTEIEAVLTYIVKVSSGKAGEVNTTPAVDPLAGLNRKNIDKGAHLFSGKEKFSAGGLACSNCHRVKDNDELTAGTMAKELTTTYEIMGGAGIMAILRSPPFPAMQNSYNKHQITEEEIIDLTAYLQDVSQNRYYQNTRDYSLLFVFAGLFFCLGIILLTLGLYFRRKKGSVKDEIFDRQSQVIN